MDTPPPPSEAVTKLAEMLANVMGIMAPVREAVAGYRKSLVEAGIGPDAADQMAVVFHTFILDRFNKGATK